MNNNTCFSWILGEWLRISSGSQVFFVSPSGYSEAVWTPQDGKGTCVNKNASIFSNSFWREHSCPVRCGNSKEAVNNLWSVVQCGV